jgi:hypothetical protein
MFARLGNRDEASSASLSEHSKSRRMICSKSSVTCGSFDSLRKGARPVGVAHKIVCGICTMVAAGGFEFENNF